MPAMNENKAILKDIQDINKNLQKRTTPEQAQMLNTSIEVRVKMLESRSALYKELAQAASALKEYAATTEDQMKLQQRAARFEKAAKDWELSAREARQLQETGRKLMAQSQPPLQEQARVAPPSPTLVQLQDSLVNVESAIKEIKQTNPEALITRAELAFKEMGEKLKTWTTPNEANALWQKTQSTLNEVQQRISTLYPKAETPMQEAYELVNKVTSHTHPGDPEWDQTVHLADQVSTLITRQNELEKALDRVSTLLSSAERLADEYNSPTDQLTDVFLRTSEDNAWIASKVSGLWNWVSSFVK